MRRLLLGLVALLLIAGAAFGFLTYKAMIGVDASDLEASYVTPSDRFVTVSGMRVRVREEGPAGAPVLLMIHGFTFSLESFDALADRLKSDYRVVRYDMRGHGLTGPDPQKRYAPEQRAEHVAQIMDTLGIDRATIVGNSLGGLAAWRFAAAYPERVERLVLISAGAYPLNGVSDEPAPVPPPVAAYLRVVPEAGVEASVARIYADADAVTEERKTLLRDMMRREGNGEAFVEALEVFTLPDPEPILATIDAPTLILWGAEDLLIDPVQGEAMAQALPNAELMMLPNVGHVAHEEQPAAVEEAMRTFLQSPDRLAIQ